MVHFNHSAQVPWVPGLFPRKIGINNVFSCRDDVRIGVLESNFVVVV